MSSPSTPNSPIAGTAKVLCYLCSQPMDDKASSDHAVPATLIKRPNPKTPGYDYAGRLPTHTDCNNRFGPETFVSKALDLLSVWDHPEFRLEMRHPRNPTIRILALNADLLPSFTEGDLRFFKMFDARGLSADELGSPAALRTQHKGNPERDALLVALSVLAKSSAALLLKRHRVTIPPIWRICAFPYRGELDSLDFGDVLPKSKPFDEGLQTWIQQLETGDYFVVWRANQLLVFMTFVLRNTDVVPHLRRKFGDADTYYFEAETLNELLSVGWKKL